MPHHCPCRKLNPGRLAILGTFRIRVERVTAVLTLSVRCYFVLDVSSLVASFNVWKFHVPGNSSFDHVLLQSTHSEHEQLMHVKARVLNYRKPCTYGQKLYHDSLRETQRHNASLNGCETWFLAGWEKRTYERVSKSFRTGRLERELQMVQLSAARCSCSAAL